MIGSAKILCVSPDVRPGVSAILDGFEQVGILDRFITTLVYNRSRKFDSCLEGMPGGSRLRRLLLRRSLSPSLNIRVETYPLRELIRTSFARWGKSEVVADRIWWWAERGFDRKVAQKWAGRLPFLYGFELASVETFRAQKKAGGQTILNQLSAHHKTARTLLAQELDEYPEVATNYDRRLQETAPLIGSLKDEQYELSDLIVANSDFVRQSFTDAGVPGEKIVVIPGAGPTPPVTSANTRFRDRVIFLSAGTQSVLKGTPYLLDAWRQLSVKRGAELWIVGKNKLPARLMKGLPDSVQLRPTVSRAELFAIYRQASVLVLPSLCEGFALVIFEAMAHGLPIITTPNSGCGDFVEDGRNGWIVPIRSSELLADRMQWCIYNRELLNEMGSVSRAKAGRWTWDDYALSHGTLIKDFMTDNLHSNRATSNRL